MRTALILLACLAAACGTSTPPEATEQAALPLAKSSAPVIATLATNSARVSILGGAKNGEPLRVIVRNLEGTIVADGITVDELQRTDPLLGALITHAVAAAKAPKGDYVDATYTPPEPSRAL